MAEVAGLVLSGVALASLFKTCVEFVEYFEDTRDWVFDFGLALAKINLLKTRLSKLEDIMSPWVSAPDIEQLHCAELPHHQESQAITYGLKGVDDILERASKLCRRYSHKARSSQWPENGRLIGDRTGLEWPSAKGRPGQRLTGRISLVVLRVTWAAYDKRRFDSLISDFDFFLSNLETVVHCSSRPVSRVGSSPSAEAHNPPISCPRPTLESRTDALPPPDSGMPSKSAESSKTRSHHRSTANSGQKRQASHPASSHSVPRAETMLPIEGSNATGITSSTYTENQVEDYAVANLGDERAPFEGETGNLYLGNTMRGHALVHAGRVSEATSHAMINAWVAMNQSERSRNEE